MSAWDGLNRRRFPRAKYPCLVIVRHKGKEPEAILTHTENLGVGGICVIIKKQIKLFAPVEVEIDLMDLEDHVECAGKVVWSVKRKSGEKVKPLFYDTGIEFENLSGKDRKRIEGIIRRIAKQRAEVIPYS